MYILKYLDAGKIIKNTSLLNFSGNYFMEYFALPSNSVVYIHTILSKM